MCVIVLSLQLRDTRLQEYDPRDLSRREATATSGALARALEARGLRFSFQDGRVEALCASDADDAWVVNIKRGVLSALQNSMTTLDDDSTVLEVSSCQHQHTQSYLSSNEYELSVYNNHRWYTCGMMRTDIFEQIHSKSHVHVLELYGALFLLTVRCIWPVRCSI